MDVAFYGLMSRHNADMVLKLPDVSLSHECLPNPAVKISTLYGLRSFIDHTAYSKMLRSTTSSNDQPYPLQPSSLVRQSLPLIYLDKLGANKGALTRPRSIYHPNFLSYLAEPASLYRRLKQGMWIHSSAFSLYTNRGHLRSAIIIFTYHIPIS
jgi:hypothetical protein